MKAARRIWIAVDFAQPNPDGEHREAAMPNIDAVFDSVQ